MFVERVVVKKQLCSWCVSTRHIHHIVSSQQTHYSLALQSSRIFSASSFSDKPVVSSPRPVDSSPAASRPDTPASAARSGRTPPLPSTWLHFTRLPSSTRLRNRHRHRRLHLLHALLLLLLRLRNGVQSRDLVLRRQRETSLRRTSCGSSSP